MTALLFLLIATTLREDFDQAVAAYRSGLYGPTLYAMEQLLLEPEFDAVDSAFLLAGQSAFALARYDKALRYLERHLRDAPDPAPQALGKAVISALELNQAGKAYSLFADYPRFELSQDVKLRLASELEERKEYEKARDLYRSIDDPDIRLVGAKMLLAAGRYDLLRVYLADLEETYPEVAATIAALQIEATLSRGDSLSSLEAGLAMGRPSQISAKEAYILGELFEAFALYEDAVEFYSSAVDQRRYDALLPLSESYAALGNNRSAVKTYEEVQKRLSFSSYDRSLEARVRLLAGQDFDSKALAEAKFRTYDEYVRALEILADKEHYPLYERLLISSPFVRSAEILRRARLLGSQERFAEALEVYEDYLAHAPFASERSEAFREAELLRYFEIKDAEAALKKLIAATSSSEKGKVLFEDAKDYEGAIAFLDTVPTPQAFYYSALSYERLYLRDGKVKFLDRARERYENLYWQFPENRLVEDALYHLFVTEIRDPLKKVDRALDYLDHYPEGSYAEEISFLLGYVQLARGDTLTAQSGWETLYLTRPQSPYNYPVLFELARLSLAEADTTDAAAKLSLILSMAPHDTLYFLAARELAILEEARGRNLEALRIYRKIAEELSTLPADLWQRSLDLIFALRQYNEFDNFQAALQDAEYDQEIEFFKEVAKVEREIAKPEDIKHLLHARPAGRKDSYLYWAGVGAGLIDHLRLGRHLLERLTREGKNEDLMAKAEFLLAQYKIAGGEDSSAVVSLRRLNTRNPDDTLILAKLVIALYRCGGLREADSLWLRLDLMSVSDQAVLLLEKVAYLLNSGRILEADSVLAALSNVRALWQNENFVYYSGVAAARQGRLEDAMGILKGFISDFSRSELLPAVYFKLGSLFYMQQEFDSSASYYRHTLTAPDLRPLALENLGKMARRQEEWDKALEYFEILAEEVTSSEERGKWYMELGVTAYYASKFSQAITYFERAVPLVTEERPRLLYWTARSYAAFADPERLERAVALFLQCHEEFPQDQWGLESWFQAGEGYIQLERYDDARVIFNAIVAERGENDPFGMRAQTALEKLQE
ncbi:MAG: tetratricopeptide repeat protein [Candidatus Stahlbacteria bacterium]|nr:MAG: tetratricopeptide repeat protein [Candidatus Stahlbacteria bacterium]